MQINPSGGAEVGTTANLRGSTTLWALDWADQQKRGYG